MASHGTVPNPTRNGPAKTGQRSRRRLLAKALATAGGAAVLFRGRPGRAAEVPRDQGGGAPEQGRSFVKGNLLERLLEDLTRALKRPVEQRRWVMVIDLQKCVGCKACTASCMAENNLPPDVVYRPVFEEETGEYPKVRKRFTPRPCMHCAKPVCVEVCPEEAIFIRPDGIVAIDYEKCTNQANCVHQCPYQVPVIDLAEFFGEGTPDIADYETRPNFEYGKPWKRNPDEIAPPMGKARKCHFCVHRIENRMLPACVTTCLGGATFFGDANDEKSLVHELVGFQRATRLKEELGTEPNVFYLA